MTKKIFTYVFMIVTAFAAFAQTTKYKGTMTVGDYTRKNVVIQVRENGKKADGTIFRAKFARLMPVKVDADIRGLNRTVQGDKTFLSGNNLIPPVKNQPKEKYAVTKFNGVMENDELRITTYFGQKKVTYNGKKIN